MQGGVFLNYRGADSHSYAAMLRMELSREFGADQVFLDSVSIPAGADFVEQLLRRVRAARAMLAVVGTRWLSAAAPEGGRRIDDPEDWIRRELVEAELAGVRVIPVLVDGAALPAAADLPQDLAWFARCQYRRLRHRDAPADVARLVADLAELGIGRAKAARPGRTDQLIEALLACQAMETTQQRDLVVGGLPPHLRAAITRYGAARPDVLSMVRTAERYPGGLADLVAAVQLVEGATAAAGDLDHLAAALPDAAATPR